MLGNLTGWHFMILFAFTLVVWAVLLVLWIIALVQIAKARAAAVVTVLWVAVITLVPLLGAIAWFVVGRRSASQQPQSPPAPPAAP